MKCLVWRASIPLAGLAIALGATSPAAFAASRTATSVPVSSAASPASEDPPPGFIMRDHSYGPNWGACQVAGTAGVVTFQWEGYVCLQDDFGNWLLWIHPW
jgi:hypothetical protein